jgi:anaerobic ribonucleoside-triphosphate reductase
LYLALLLESQNKFQEALVQVELALQPERKNPFPEYCFLIENRAYHDSSTFLEELKQQLIKKIEEPVISNKGVIFDF